MDQKTAIIKLQNISIMLKSLISKVANKRSWLDSEKAMTVSEYRMQLEAIEMAIKTFDGSIERKR